jgi:glycosyltransferase involved in cell wall biosynthesis
MRLKRKSKKLPSTLIKQTVDVLLATYNGEKFLEEQLQSLEQQKDVNVRVWANDDGSDDATLKILLKWQRSGLIVDITKTQRIGSTRAFLKLLSEHSDSEYVAFCDQDDVWDPIKLITQVGNLTSEMPMAITSERLFIDEAGTIIGKSKKLRMAPSFENAIVENIAPGNTILMNNRAIKLVNEFSNPTVEHYDSWIYLLTSAFGKVECLNQPLIKYRIHENNLVGLRRYVFRRFITSTQNYLKQAQYFNVHAAKDISNCKRSSLEDLVSIFEKRNTFQKFVQLLKLEVTRQRKLDAFVIKVIFIFLILATRV